MSDPITKRRSSRHRASLSPGTPPSHPPLPLPRAQAMPLASQIANAAASSSSASAGQQYSTFDIMGNSDSELSDLTESEAGMDEKEEKEEEVVGAGSQVGVTVTVPLPRNEAAASTAPRGKRELTASGEGIKLKKHNRVISSSDDESDGRGGTSDQNTTVKKRVGNVPKARESRDSPSTSSFVGEPGRRKREQTIKVFPTEATRKLDDAGGSDRDTDKGSRTKRLKIHPKAAERGGSVPADRSTPAGHERDSERAATGKRRDKMSTERDTRGSSPLAGEPLKRKSALPSQDAPRDTSQQAARRSKQDRRDDEAYEDESDHGLRRGKEGSPGEGETYRAKGTRAREEVEGERRAGKKMSRDEIRSGESRRDEERPRKRKPVADADRGKEAQHRERERRRPGVDSDGDDVKDVTPSSQDGPSKKKKRPLNVDTPDSSDIQKKHPLAVADRPPLKREDSEVVIQSSHGESSRVQQQKRPGQAISGKRVTELSTQGARTPATNSKPRTPINGNDSGPSRRGPGSGGQVKKPYDPLAGALSSLAGIAPPETGSGASTPINRKPLLKSEMAPAAELTEAREQAQKKRQELYAKQVRLNSMSHGILIREYEERPKPWLRRAGIPRDDVTGKYAEATVQAIINLRDQGYFGENVDTWPSM
ncbi:hypothetical protein NliqN6_5536 [Naganishia liquefaciens]|uniref:Uncharacterized protein n=1 Tax=Naganishia liquefaciens TaxID=104408 RepID=A0A8H3TZQ1_9TREE|nr:hypothetical protein NliqN6_5536 [Naganishia liquefaciens]